MHWLALVDGPDHVCCRYRLKAFVPFFERSGHTLEFVSLPPRWWGRLGLLRRLGNASVILQRKLLAGWELTLLRRTVRRLVFDFDDAVFLRDSFSPKGLDDARRLHRFARTVCAADAVVAGNSYLAAEAARWPPTNRDYVIPTCVDPTRYPILEPWPFTAPLQLVWIGSSSTVPYVQTIAPLLEEAGRALPGLQLKMICDRFLHFANLAVVECPWNEASEAEEIAAADVGISWLPDDRWSQGKCGLKVLQYMAAGLPVIANPVGVHREMIRHGETGFLAATPAEWIEALQRLSREPELREQMGRAGRRAVETTYSVAAGARSWLIVFDELEPRTLRTA
jgi:glycosyltransferase involved in cell wall biosynthesis